MTELDPAAMIEANEYLPGALGDFITPNEKVQLAIGRLGVELIELAVARSRPFELPDDLQQLVVASRSS